MTIELVTADCVEWMNSQPENRFDLVFGSPPYLDARSYGIDAQRNCQDWIEWMLTVSDAAVRVSKGAVLWVVAGVTRHGVYQPGPEGLIYEWWKRGNALWRPHYWHRNGIPGSGGKQWFRGDVEYVICFKRPGPLPWSDNTACGSKPKWSPGGKLSYRDVDGKRRHKIRGTSGYDNGDATYHPADGKLLDRAITEIANPGNMIHTNNGGGHLGDRRAHENEAPFPEMLAEFFVHSLCPEGGEVLDPFSGSGTTVSVCGRLGRNGVGVDVRETQTEIARRRCAEVQPVMF